MITLQSALEIYIWVATPAVQTAIVVALFWRRLAREYLMFLLYSVFVIVSSLALWMLDQRRWFSYDTYFYSWWACAIGWVALRFAVIGEVYRHLFADHAALQQVGRQLFRWSAALLVLAGLAVAALASGNTGDRLFRALSLLERTVDVVQCGMLIVLFLFSSYLLISWRNRVFGIALGLGLVAAAELVATALSAQLGPAAPSQYTTTQYLIEYLHTGVYHVCAWIWLIYLLLPERQESTARVAPTHELEPWNKELERLLRR
jgi:F0F1-type ATP synthase membrane subunit c/vacuolar-type H+-ATPase subunit K